MIMTIGKRRKFCLPLVCPAKGQRPFKTQGQNLLIIAPCLCWPQKAMQSFTLQRVHKVDLTSRTASCGAWTALGRGGGAGPEKFRATALFNHGYLRLCSVASRSWRPCAQNLRQARRLKQETKRHTMQYHAVVP